MQVFMEQELRRIDRGRAFIFKQGRRMVSREITYGVYSQMRCENVPPQYEIDELEEQLLQTQIKLSGEPLMAAYKTDDILVLDNKKNRNVGSAAIMTYPQEETFILVAFNQSDLEINYIKAMNDLKASINKYRIFNYPQLNLNYEKPYVRPDLQFDFSPDGHIKMQGFKLKYLNKKREYDPYTNRLCALFMLNPLYPTFAYDIDLIHQICQVCEGLFVCVMIKGSDSSNIRSIMKQSQQLGEMNLVQEYSTFADKLLSKQSFYCFLVDQCPEQARASNQSMQNLKYKLTQEKRLSQKIQEIVNQPVYFDDTQIPGAVYESPDFPSLLEELEQAFQVQIDKKFFKYSLEDKTCQLYGVRNKLTVYNDNVDNKYSVVYFSKKLDVRNILSKLAECCNVFICIKGIYQLTLKNVAINSNITQCNVIHDDNNIHRVVDDIFATTTDHVMLFDEDMYQVATEFGVDELKQIIDRHTAEKMEQLRIIQEEEEERLRREQQRLQREDEDIEFVDDNQPLIRELAEIQLPGCPAEERSEEEQDDDGKLADYGVLAGQGSADGGERGPDAAPGDTEQEPAGAQQPDAAAPPAQEAAPLDAYKVLSGAADGGAGGEGEQGAGGMAAAYAVLSGAAGAGGE